MRTSRAILLVLAAAGVLQLVHYYPLLPETMASHFDGSGHANGFQSRDGFAAFTMGILALTVLIFAGMGWLFRVLPSEWLNLPNRDYWLASERRDETLEDLSRRMEWFGAASLALYLFVIQRVIETNRTGAPRLDPEDVLVPLGLYLGFSVVWMIGLFRRFRRPA
ncbi:MAG TPA: DUF1648 domain-containing protein [Vicinamibacteria bacterium]